MQCSLISRISPSLSICAQAYPMKLPECLVVFFSAIITMFSPFKCCLAFEAVILHALVTMYHGIQP
jgi:hypothetical protein